MKFSDHFNLARAQLTPCCATYGVACIPETESGSLRKPARAVGDASPMTHIPSSCPLCDFWPVKDFFHNILSITMFAVLGTLVSTFIIGYFTYVAGNMVSQ